MNLILIFMLVFASIVKSDKDSDEGRFIDLLPTAEKKEFLEKIARRILEEVKSQEVLAESGEIPDSQLDKYNSYVAKLLNEERRNIKRKSNDISKSKHSKRNADLEDEIKKVKGLEKEEGSDGGERTKEVMEVLQKNKVGNVEGTKEGIKRQAEDGNQVLETVKESSEEAEQVKEGNDSKEGPKEGRKGLERVKEESDSEKATEQLMQGVEKVKERYDGNEETEEGMKGLENFKDVRDGEERTKGDFEHIDLTLRERNVNNNIVPIIDLTTLTTRNVDKTEKPIDYLMSKEYVITNLPSTHELTGEIIPESDNSRTSIVKIVNNDDNSREDDTNDNISIDITLNGKRPTSKQAYINQTAPNNVTIPVNVAYNEPINATVIKNSAKNKSFFYTTRKSENIRNIDKTKDTTYINTEIKPDTAGIGNKYEKNTDLFKSDATKAINHDDENKLLEETKATKTLPLTVTDEFPKRTQFDKPIDETKSILLERNVSKNIAKNYYVMEKFSNIHITEKDNQKENNHNSNITDSVQRDERVPTVSDREIVVSEKYVPNSPIHVIIPIKRLNTNKRNEDIKTESKINNASTDEISETYIKPIDHNHILRQGNSATSEKIYLTTDINIPKKMWNKGVGNVVSSIGKDLLLKNHGDNQIEKPKPVLELQKFSANKRARENYEVYEIPAGLSPFTQKPNKNKQQDIVAQEYYLERRTEAGESPHYVPVHNYAPNNAYYNPYNRLGPNEYDQQDDIENKYSREDDINDSNYLKNIIETDRKYQNNPVHVVSNFNHHKKYKSAIAQRHNVPNTYSSDYFDMDYYFGRSDKRPNFRSQKQGRHRNEKEILRELSLSSPNSYENDHPDHIPRNMLKDHLSAARQAMSSNNILRSESVTSSTMSKKTNNKFEGPDIKLTDFSKTAHIVQPLSDQSSNPGIAFDYYFENIGEFNKLDANFNPHKLRQASLPTYDSSKVNTIEHVRLLSNKRKIKQNVKQHNVKTPKKPLIEKQVVSEEKDIVPVIITPPKLQRDIKSELDTYLTLMGNAIKSANPGLYQYDWLGTAVDIQAALKKLIVLTKDLQAGNYIHHADLELMYYLVHLFQFSKKHLKPIINSENQNNNFDEANKYLKYMSENNSPKMKKYFDLKLDDEESEEYKKTKNSEYPSSFNGFISEGQSPKKSKLNVTELTSSKIKEYLLSLVGHKPSNFRISSNGNKAKESKKTYMDLEVDPSEIKQVVDKLKKNRSLETFQRFKQVKDKVPYRLSDLTPWQIHVKNNKDSEIKSPMPRNRRKNSRRPNISFRRLINDITPLVPMLTQQLENNFENNLKDFEEFLENMQYALNDLHNAIKHVAMVSKYNQPLYRNLKDLYLTEPNYKTQVTEILIHIIATRLIGLIEESLTEGLERDYVKYMENNKKNVENIKEEFVLLLRLLGKLGNIDRKTLFQRPA